MDAASRLVGKQVRVYENVGFDESPGQLAEGEVLAVDSAGILIDEPDLETGKTAWTFLTWLSIYQIAVQDDKPGE